MPRKRRCAILLRCFPVAFCACLSVTPLTLSLGSAKRVRLASRFFQGETLRYQIESRTTTKGNLTTPIVNPEGASQSTQVIHLLVRLEVLDLPVVGGSGQLRLRATYEKSSAESDSDAFDPAQPSLAAEFARLEGRSIELTVEPDGDVTAVKGLDEILPDRLPAQSALSWLSEFSITRAFPKQGIEIGQKWRSERPLAGVPLAGLAWRVESTYLRDETCPRAAGTDGFAPEPSSAPEPCAVILSRFEITRRSSAGTPEDYHRNGLRVLGSWTGSGESLDSISPSTGLLVRATQSTDQQIDYRITSAATGSSIRNQSHIQAQSEITLLPRPSPADP